MRKQISSVLLAVAAAASVVTGGVAHADEGKRIYNGMQIVFEADPASGFCSIGAVGNDDYGRKIAISAGHCLTDPGHANQDLTENLYPIWDRNDVSAGVIGHVRYFRNNGGSDADAARDYMIIELVPSVLLSSTGTHLKQTGEMKTPNGSPTPIATVTPVLDTERLVGTSWQHNNEIVKSGQLGVWYARITGHLSGVYVSSAPTKGGDSGGPAIWHVPGSAYPSEANGFKAEGPWIGITRGIILWYPQYATVSSANILADLRARDVATPADVYGAGFEVTTNP
ncbi:hypothetical protein GCM10027589_06090 [Actinocorallia lasiicapitis]